MRPSDVSAIPALEGKTLILSYRDHLPMIQAALIVYTLMGKMNAELCTPEYHLACEMYGLPAVPEGFILLDRVLHHLELELRRN